MRYEGDVLVWRQKGLTRRAPQAEGTVQFDGKAITIQTTGRGGPVTRWWDSKMEPHRYAGVTHLRVSAIQSIDWFPGHEFNFWSREVETDGSIALSLFDADDKVVIFFHPSDREKFEALRAAIEEALSDERPRNGPELIADELAKLVQLRDVGALTDEEFAAQKGRLLGT